MERRTMKFKLPCPDLWIGEYAWKSGKRKKANIVLADGDILELRTNIKRVFIDGKEVDLSNRYTELLEKFKKRG